AGSNATTGEDGTYHIEGLAPGSWDVTFIHDGYGTELRQGVEVKEGEGAAGIDQILGPATAFTVRVVNASGAPVAGALLLASQNGVTLNGLGGMSREDGTVLTRQLKPGIYSFQALTRDLAPGVVRDVSVGGEKDSDSAT